MVEPQGGGGGCTLILFSYIRRLGSFFGIQNFEFQYFWGVFRKMNIFLGYEDFADIFSTKLNYIKGSFLCILGSFLKVNVKNGGIFFWLLKSQIFFWGCLKFLIFFGGER